MAAASGCTSLRTQEEGARAVLALPDSLLDAELVCETLLPESHVAVAPLPQVDLPPDSLLLKPSEREAFFEALRTEVIGLGMASFYGARFAGRKTASGERFSPDKLTAAHRTLPFGARVRVTNLTNGKAVVVRINDRGPFIHRRIIDLSRAAAQQIGMVQSGVARVQLELLPERKEAP